MATMQNSLNEDGFPGLHEPFVPKTIHLHLILDVSPSMHSRWTQTISGLNEYLDSLRADQKEENQPYKVTMTTFSAEVDKVYDEVELDVIPKFTEKNLQPHGWGTALYEAVGPTVQAIDTTDPVLVVIITDGEENSSKQWDESRVEKLLDERQKLGNYTYAYLGVAKEAWGNTAKVHSFAASNMNLTADQYAKGATFSAQADGLGGLTRSYSATMRSNSMRGMSMNVSNFYSPSTTDAPDADAVPVSTTTGHDNNSH